jgi:hypothetical protein
MAQHDGPQLTHVTGDVAVDTMMRVLVAACEAAFPGRVWSYLLSGSYAEGDPIPGSDLDLGILFRGDVTDDEQARLRTLVADMQIAQTDASAPRLDVIALDETYTLQSASAGLAEARPIYGEDVRGIMLLEPLEHALARHLSAATFYIWQMRGQRAGLVWPLNYPDPAGEFFGYDRYGYFNGDDAPEMYTPGARTIINCATMIATAQMTHAGLRVPSKRRCVAMFADFAPSATADWLARIYDACKLRWRYRVPDAPAERALLRNLCAPMLAMENDFLAFARPLNRVALTQHDNYASPRAQDRVRWVAYPGE